MRKMIVSDYDGTFFINNNDIKYNIEMAHRFMKNNVFIIATGRSYSDLMAEQDKHKMNYNYLIINHGATILYDNKILANKMIDNNIKDQIVQNLDLNNLVNHFTCSALKSRLSLKDNDLTKIHLEYPNEKIAAKVYNDLIHKYSNDINVFLVTENRAVEIVSSKVNKAISIDEISTLEGIEEKNIYVIGDHYNDIEMIKKYKGSSMVNSVSEVQQISLKKYSSVSHFINEVLNNTIDNQVK